MRCAICYDLYNLKNVKNAHRGMLLLVKLPFEALCTIWYHQPAILLEVTRLHERFSCFLNCTNGTKSRKASYIISNVGNYGNDLPKNQTGQRSLLKAVKVDWFSSSVWSWSRLFLMLKICLLEIPQIPLIVWAISLQRKNFLFISHVKSPTTPLPTYPSLFPL